MDAGVSRGPSLAGRFIRLMPAEYELRDQPFDELPPNTWIEDALIHTDSGEHVWVFAPDSIARSLVGRRCLLELAAWLGEVELLSGSLGDGQQVPAGLKVATQEIIGKVRAYYRDGVILNAGEGSVALRECIDDRVEPGRLVRVSGFRLDLERILAVEDDANPGQWASAESDPFADPERALQTLRAGEAQVGYIPGVALDDRMKATRHYEAPRMRLWGKSVSALVYRLGETGLREAEPDVAGFLDHDDTHLARAAVWVLSRHWGMTKYAGRLLDIGLGRGEGGVRQCALIGAGILLRGTRDREATRRLVSLVRDTSAYWYLRDAAYFALLGIWLPDTADLREAWRWWRAPGPPKWRWLRRLRSRRPYAGDRRWAKRIDWTLVSRLERAS